MPWHWIALIVITGGPLLAGFMYLLVTDENIRIMFGLLLTVLLCIAGVGELLAYQERTTPDAGVAAEIVPLDDCVRACLARSGEKR